MRGFDFAYSFGFYEGTLRALIHLFKYSGMKPLAERLSGLLLRAIPLDLAHDAAYDFVVPMPLHWRRRWKRGFNQAKLLARHVGVRRGIPVLDAVRRVRATATQAGLTNSNRRKNVSGAFRVAARYRRNGALSGKRILLIDDVMTTGATGAACAHALKRAGARSVTLLTLARTDRRFVSLDATSKSTKTSGEYSR
jgi:ComF family protein